MPFALLFVGMILIITGFQNTYKQFGTMVAGDFSGNQSFLYWLASIGVVGSVGYIKGAESFSRAFMALILIAMIVNNKGLFANLQSAIVAGSTSETNPIGANLQGASGGGGNSGGGGLSDLITPGNIAAVASFL